MAVQWNAECSRIAGGEARSKCNEERRCRREEGWNDVTMEVLDGCGMSTTQREGGRANLSGGGKARDS